MDLGDTERNYVDPAALADLVRRAQAGDFGAELADEITLLVRRLGGDEDDVQSTLLEAVRALGRIDPERNVFAYLTAVARSVIARRVRRLETYEGMLKRWAWLNGWVPVGRNGKRLPMRFEPPNWT